MRRPVGMIPRFVPAFAVLTLVGATAWALDSKDEITARHGDVYLYLTGTCGAGGEGRRAVVQNRNRYKGVRVRIQTSLWVDGRLKSSSVKSHSLRALQAKVLGCAVRVSEEGERATATPQDGQSYDMVGVSDASVHLPNPLHPESPHYLRPPVRDAVEFVSSGRCGRNGQGRYRSVTNLHEYLKIIVVVQYVDKVNGKATRTYQKTHSLGPGAQRRLGCTADGRLSRDFSLVSARYQ